MRTFALFALLTVCLSEDVHFTEMPSDTTVTSDGSQVLGCQLSTEVICAWRVEAVLATAGFLNSHPPPLIEAVDPLHPTDCSIRFTHPTADYAGLYSCAPYTPAGQQILSDWATVTVLPGTTTPATSTQATTTPFACHGPDGNYPDPTDCRYFYICANGQAIREACPGHLVFNAQTGNCDYPEHVPGCQ